jgi:hypothetical protein
MVLIGHANGWDRLTVQPRTSASLHEGLTTMQHALLKVLNLLLFDNSFQNVDSSH